jgi:hypothetical protein
VDNFRIRVYPVVMSQMDTDYTPDLSRRESLGDGLPQANGGGCFG